MPPVHDDPGRWARHRVIIPENKRLENWTSPALTIDGDDDEEIEIHRRADPRDPEARREWSACA